MGFHSSEIESKVKTYKTIKIVYRNGTVKNERSWNIKREK